MRAGVLTASLLAVLCLGSGCASECESVCEEANACDVKERPVDVECNRYCEDVDALQARAKSAEKLAGFDAPVQTEEGEELVLLTAEELEAAKVDCGTQWTEHLSCWESNSANICQSPDDSEKAAECAEKAQAWVDCMKPYCAAVDKVITAADEAGVTVALNEPNCSGDEPALAPF